jgi:peptidoglycan/LPS O-acetylase OafA/YrhL
LRVVYHIVLHLLGLGCVSACIAIVGTMGALDIHWTGWVAVAFLGLLSIGIVLGWFPWRGKPLRVLLKGFYVMSAVALIGFGFSMQDPMRPQLWMVLAPLAAAIVVRAVIRVAKRGRSDDQKTNSAPLPIPRRADDSFSM